MNEKEPEVLFKKYYKYMVFIANSITRNFEESKQIAIDAFVKAMTSFDNCQNEAAVKQMLIICTKNESINYLKLLRNRRSRETEYWLSIDETIDIEMIDLKYELIGKILELAEELPGDRKRIFLLSFLKGLKQKEIAKILGISINTVGVQKARAMKYIKNKINRKI